MKRKILTTAMTRRAAMTLATVMTRRAAMMLLMMMLTTATVWAQEAITGLTYNSAGGYYEINDAQDLVDLANYVNAGHNASGKWFKQTANLNMSGVTWTPIGDIEGSTGNHRFYGNYDGNCKRIFNLTYNGSGVGGLFGYVGNSSGSTTNTLKNIRLVNCSITSTSGNAGGIVVSAARCNIENCEVTGTIDAHSYYAGGIVANISDGSITGCFASGSVQARSKTGSSYLHGMIAGHISSTTTGSYNTYISSNGVGAGNELSADFATEQLTSGTTADGLSWSLGGTYHTELTISGSGTMQNYDTNTILSLWRTTAPWGWHLTEVTVDNGVTSIGNYAFVGDQSLADIYLSSDVTTIGQGAFDRCDAAREITLSASVTTIAYGAFANCKGLEQFNINHDGAVTLGGSDVFTGCDALQYIVFPSPAGALANTTGNWSGYSSKLRAHFGGQLFLATNEGGTPAYKIATEQDLRNLSAAITTTNDGTGLTFRQTADIAMSSTNFTPIGIDGLDFRGTYDGGHHVISGLTVNSTYRKAGLFGTVYGGIVKDLALVDPSISTSVTDNPLIGAIVAYGFNNDIARSQFTNLYTYGTNLNVIAFNDNSKFSTVTNVAHTSAITLDADISTTTPATDAANGFVYKGVSYYRQGLALTLTTTATPDAGYLNSFTIDDSMVDNPLTVTAAHDGKTIALGSPIPDPAHFSVSGDEYTIHTATGWNVFCDALQDNDTYNRFSGKTVKLGADIGTAEEPVTRMAGPNYHDFTGTFDGDGHTLTFAGEATDNYLAPFCNVQGNGETDHAVIRNLNVVTNITATDYRHMAGLMAKAWGYVDVTNCNVTVDITSTKGTNNPTELYPAGLASQVVNDALLTISGCTVDGKISTDGKYAGGFIGIVQGSASIVNSVSGVTINSSTAGDGTHGGLVGVQGNYDGSTINIDGCVFNGELLGSSTTCCGGFVGWRSKTVNISNSLFAPAQVGINTTEGNTPCATFVRNGNSTPTNSYYTTTLGTAQGKQARTITGGEHVTISGKALTGDATPYTTSGITAYSGGGLALDDGNGTTLYYGSDDQVSLTLANSVTDVPEGYGFGGYTASPDGATLTGSANPYTLTMPDADVTVSVMWTAETYTINYNLDGGHLPTGQSNPATYTVETETFTLVNPERDGYAFAGWTGTGLNGATKTVTITQGTTTGNRDYTATWTLLPVSYIDADGIERTVVATPLAEYNADWDGWYLSTTTLTAGQWYYVNNNIIGDERITVSGSGAANIILCDGKKLEFRDDNCGGISGNITIYSQLAGTGKMEIYGHNDYIPATQYSNAIDGELTIYGGDVVVEGSPGNLQSLEGWRSRGAIGGTVNLYGGSLKATGTDAEANFDGPWLDENNLNFDYTYSTNGITGTVNFYGGTLNACGGKHDSEYEVGDGNYDSNGINGTVNLSWDRSSDRFYADSYNGTVNVADGYTFLTDNNATISGNGISGSTLNGKTLRPDTNSALHDDGDNRYTILTGAGWNLFCNMVKDGETFSGKTVYLGSDITASNIAGNATHKFQGEFDGQGNTVSGLNVYRGGTDPDVDSYVGLFAYLGSGANVHHVNLANSSFTGRNYIGGIAGHQDGGTVSYCTVASTVSINDAVIGTNQAPNNYHGGIVGYLYNGTVSHCVSSATLTVVDASSNSLGYGAIVGLNVNGSITDNLAIGATIPSSAKSSMAVIVGNRIGGVLQRNYYTNCTVRGVANATGVGHFATGAKPNLSDLTENDGAVPALRDGADNSTALALMAAVPEKFGTYSVSLNGRTLSKSGEWNTLCLPFDIDDFSGTPLEGATVKELDTEGTYEGHQTGLDGTTLYLYFQDATSIKAGKPYIVKWEGASGSVSDPVFSGVTVSSTAPTAVTFTGGSFVGQYSPFSITADNIDEIILLSTGNRLGYSQNPRTLHSFRAHFKVPTSGGVREFVLDFGDEETTGIISPAEIKEITEMAGAWYSIDGRKLDTKPTAKGVYIRGGKKVIIK